MYAHPTPIIQYPITGNLEDLVLNDLALLLEILIRDSTKYLQNSSPIKHK